MINVIICMTANDSNFAQLSEGLECLASFLEIDYWQLQELQGFWVAWSCPWNEGASGHRQDSGAPPSALPCCPAVPAHWVNLCAIHRSRSVDAVNGECLVPRFELSRVGHQGPCVAEGRCLVMLWAATKKHCKLKWAGEGRVLMRNKECANFQVSCFG